MSPNWQMAIGETLQCKTPYRQTNKVFKFVHTYADQIEIISPDIKMAPVLNNFGTGCKISPFCGGIVVYSTQKQYTQLCII